MLRIPIIVRPFGIEEDEYQIYEIHIGQILIIDDNHRSYLIKLYKEGKKLPLKEVYIKKFRRDAGAVKLLELALKKLNYEEKNP